jgi:hypothetical protein
MARKSDRKVVLHKHVLAVMRRIGDILPRLDDSEREEVFGILTAVLEYLQQQHAEERAAEFCRGALSGARG